MPGYRCKVKITCIDSNVDQANWESEFGCWNILRYTFLVGKKIVKYDGCLLQKFGSSIVIFCIADIFGL